MPPEEVRVSAILQARLVAVAKNFRCERFELRTCLPPGQWQARFLAGLFEESDAIPSVLARDLWQQQAARTRHGDKEAIPADFVRLGSHGFDLRKNTEGSFPFRSLEAR